MAVGDTIQIKQLEDGWLLSLQLRTDNPQQIIAAVAGLVASGEVRPGTIESVVTQEGEGLPENIVPLRTTPPEDVEEGAVSNDVLEAEYRNLERLNQLLVAKRTPSGYDFGMAEWEEGFARYCPHIDPVEAAYLRGEYIATHREATSSDDEDSN